MKDLEIRGDGDLLGGEQSGFINEIGFETYQKILSEAVEELKESEFKDLFRDSDGPRASYVRDIQIDTDLELLFPDAYINNVSERLSLYSELNDIKAEQQLKDFEAKLQDRFGPLPPEAADLMGSVRLKWKASALGIEKLVLKKGKFIGYFIGDQQSDFYQSEDFGKILRYIQTNPEQGRLKEKKTRNGLRLLLVIEGVDSICKALDALHPISAEIAEEVS
mgnify:CR=1 FL=1